MKKILTFLLLFILTSIASSQTWVPQYNYGSSQVAGFTQNSVFALPYTNTDIDTSKWRYEKELSTNLYKWIINKVTIGGVAPGKLKLPIYYNPNSIFLDTSRLAYLDKENTFTKLNHFPILYAHKLITDSLTINFVDSTHSQIFRNVNDSIYAYYNSIDSSFNFGRIRIVRFSDGSIYPPTNYGYDLGHYNKMFDSIWARTGNFTNINNTLLSKQDTSYVLTNIVSNLAKKQDTSYVLTNIVSNLAKKQDTSSYFAYRNTSIIPTVTSSYYLGSNLLTWKRIFTDSLTATTANFTNPISFVLQIDSIGASKSDTMYLGRNTMLVNCDAIANDTVYLSATNIANGYECTIKKIDANATYVVVRPKGSLLVDGASEDKFNTQWLSRSYIYKNNAWYIK